MGHQTVMVLLAEDSDTQRSLLAALLRQRGLGVLPAVDGAEALALLGREAPDLVITDHEMPGARGIEVALAARRLHPSARVLITSASADGARAARRAGFDFMGKPIALAPLLAWVAANAPAWVVPDGAVERPHPAG